MTNNIEKYTRMDREERRRLQDYYAERQLESAKHLKRQHQIVMDTPRSADKYDLSLRMWGALKDLDEYYKDEWCMIAAINRLDPNRTPVERRRPTAREVYEARNPSVRKPRRVIRSRPPKRMAIKR